MNRRNQVLTSLSDREFDLVVIGGGLLGAGIALEATCHGFSVLLVDKEDFASGSSSRTSKVAGLTSFVNAAQCGPSSFVQSKAAQIKELYHRAPHLVKDFSFLMPITSGRFFFSLQTQLALCLQDALTTVFAPLLAKGRAHRRLNRREALRAAPALAPNLISGALRFHDYFADDSRFVIELIKTATAKGAVAVNYLEAKEFECQNGEVKAIVLRDRIEGKEYKVLTKATVSACGVWTDELAKLIAPDEPAAAHGIKSIKSTHIMLAPSAFETDSALLLPAAGGGYVYVVPWQRALLVGSTNGPRANVPYEESLENPLPAKEEIACLLDTINAYKRADSQLSGADIACAWSGLHIVTTETNETAALFRGPNGVLTGFGGHLTDFQKMADLAVHLVTKKIGPNDPGRYAGTPKAVRRAMLGGFEDKDDYIASTAEIAVRTRKLGIEPAGLDHLLSNYGKDAMLILDLIEQNPALNEKICPDFPHLMAEVVHCVENEMAISLEDMLCRRIRLGFLHREQSLAAAPRVAKTMQELCGWDSLRLKSELSALARNLASQLAPVS